MLVAFSGGPDSTALLLALHDLLEDSGHDRLRAAHVNHGLHRNSGDWARHCEAQARSLGLSLVCREVEVRADGRGVEAAARRARYEALAELMEPGECLLTAHHQDDQWETLLLRMLRGTGIAGLAGIREKRRLGHGWLLRPLLDLPRGDLRAWLRRKGASYIDDPSNRDTGFDRSFLRNDVLPLLRGRWPGAGVTAGRLARLAGETRELLQALAEEDGRRIALADHIDCEGLLGLSPRAAQTSCVSGWPRLESARTPRRPRTGPWNAAECSGRPAPRGPLGPRPPYPPQGPHLHLPGGPR